MMRHFLQRYHPEVNEVLVHHFEGSLGTVASEFEVYFRESGYIRFEHCGKPVDADVVAGANNEFS